MIEKHERLSLALIKLAYTPVQSTREASKFKLDRSHEIATVKNMDDVPVATATLRFV